VTMPDKKSLIIIGATAPEVVKLVDAINQACTDGFNIIGFLDDDLAKHGTEFMGYPVLGPTTMLKDTYQDCWVINNVARDTPTRQKVSRKLEDMGVTRFATLVHPMVDLRYAEVGLGTIIQEGCIIGPLVKIGRHCLISFRVVIAHESTIGDCVFIAPGTIINGRVKVKTGAFLGAGSIILPHKTVGEWSLVGAGSVVTEDVPPYSTVFGAPARVIARRQPLEEML